MSSNNNTKAKSADSEDVSGRKRVREEVNGGEEEASKTARGGAPTSGSATGTCLYIGKLLPCALVPCIDNVTYWLGKSAGEGGSLVVFFFFGVANGYSSSAFLT